MSTNSTTAAQVVKKPSANLAIWPLQRPGMVIIASPIVVRGVLYYTGGTEESMSLLYFRSTQRRIRRIYYMLETRVGANLLLW